MKESTEIHHLEEETLLREKWKAKDKSAKSNYLNILFKLIINRFTNDFEREGFAGRRKSSDIGFNL